jgi:hypothetical protein
MFNDAVIINPHHLRDPGEAGALDHEGRLKVIPYAEFWQQYTQAEIAVFCHRQGLYGVPTTELIDWLRPQLEGRRAIEIGAGAGVLAEALGIPATDSFLQDRPEIAAVYRATGQPTIHYGAQVAKLDADLAMAKHRPNTVVASWVTHKWKPSESWREGNMFGVDELKIVRNADYIFIGHEHAHRDKPILDLPHETHYFDWLVSRAVSPGRNFVKVWRRQR